MKKIISMILLCAMLASTLVACTAKSEAFLTNDYPLNASPKSVAYTSEAAWNGVSVDTSWYNASASILYLEDGADLRGFIELVYKQKISFAGKTVQLKKDINLGKKAWAIPTSDLYFEGTFDGGGHTVGGFLINASTGNQSLLGSIGGGAIVKNLKVEDATVTLKASADTTGAAAVIARIVTVFGKTAKVENVSATCTITYNSSGKAYTYVGGIVGAIEGKGAAEITGCVSNGSITSLQGIVGGIVGGVKDGVAVLNVSNCKNTCKINALEVFGGIVGCVYACTGLNTTVINCENTGDLTVNKDSTGGRVAGMIGRYDTIGGKLTVTGCKNSGNISYTGTKEGGSWMGGILGYVYGSGSNYINEVTVKGCHNTGNITANRTSGGIAGFFQRVKSLSIENCTVNAEMSFSIRSSKNYYVGGLVGMINTNSKSYVATVKSCSVSGKISIDEPVAHITYTGGLIGAIRTSTVNASDCHIDVEFSKKNCEEDDTINVTLGCKENTSSILNPTNITYCFYNTVATPEDYLSIKSDNTIFKPIGFQHRYNEADNTYDMRFVFGIDNLQAEDKILGMEIALKCLDTEVTVLKATTSILGAPACKELRSTERTYVAEEFLSEYFCTYTVTGIPASEIELVEINGNSVATLKNKLITLTPFSKTSEDAEIKRGVGIEEYSVLKPERHTFEIQDFWSFLPDAFASSTGIITSQEVNFKNPSNVACQEFKQNGKDDTYILNKKCTCTGDECSCGWGATGAMALRLNENVPYHYYIDIGTYKKDEFFGKELDRYGAYHTWSFEVAEDGYYEFCFRIRLKGTNGESETRYALVQIDDEGYGRQTELYYSLVVRDGTLRDNATNHDSYLTGYGKYLTAGTHTITFRVPYDSDGTSKSSSFHFRDVYVRKGSLEPDYASLPIPTGATLYNGNFDTTTCTYVLDNTTKSVFDAYRNELTAAGFTLKEEKVTDYRYSSFDTKNYAKNKGVMHNYFYTYTNAEYMIHTYFCEGDGGMRAVISDIEEYQKYVEVRAENQTYKDITDPLFAILDIGGKKIVLQKGPNAGKTISGSTNGMCLVYRLSDGRFVLVDGGTWSATDTEGEGVERLYNWLAEHADYDGDGNYKNNKVTIAAWLITHHHSDHISVAWKFNQMYQGKNNVEIQNYLYNFPDYEFAIGIPGSNIKPDYYTEWFPKMDNLMKRSNNLVVHTGFGYQFADISIEILYTHEDLFPGTIKDFNNSNSVFKITLAGKTFLVAGDLEEPGQIDCNKMTGTLLEADFLQPTHHGYNGQIEFYKYIVGLDQNGSFNTDTIVIWPLPKGETASCYEGTGAKGIANRWLAEMFRKEDDQANDQIHFAMENWVFSDFK